MHRKRRLLLAVVLFAVVGCGKESTSQLIDSLKAPDALTRLKAVRTLPQRKGDAEQVIPALVEALKDTDAEIRRDAALGLGTFGEKAKDAVPALQTSLRDADPGVRKAAATALPFIDPNTFQDPSKPDSTPGS
jgi:HEAT repeat protein